MKTRRSQKFFQKKKKRKTKTKTRKQKQQQKGGDQIFVKFLGKTSVVNKASPRNILKKILENTPNLGIKGEFANLNQNTPPYKIELPGLRHKRLTKNNWNNKNYFSKNASTYVFLPNVTLTKSTEAERKRRGAETLEIVKKVLDHYKSGAKVISHSSATTDNIEKNINQQFKFHKAPFSPIILVDIAFFSSEQDNYEFYKYLQFEEFTVPGIGPPSIVRFYRKKAGDLLKINPDTVTKPFISEESKREYLQKVLEQVGEEIIRANEIEICCINHNSSREFEIQQYIKPTQKFYNWPD